MSNKPKTTLIDVSPEHLAQWLESGEAILIDVREDFEHKAEHIVAAQHVPIATLDPDALRQSTNNIRVVFHCRGGGRSSRAAAQFCRGKEPTYHLAGGIEAWKASGRDVVRSTP